MVRATAGLSMVVVAKAEAENREEEAQAVRQGRVALPYFSLIPAFLKALTSIITSMPAIDLAQVNQNLHSLSWNEVSIDYHCLQIAIACFESETWVRQS